MDKGFGSGFSPDLEDPRRPDPYPQHCQRHYLSGWRGGRIRKFASVLVTSQCLWLARALMTLSRLSEWKYELELTKTIPLNQSIPRLDTIYQYWPCPLRKSLRWRNHPLEEWLDFRCREGRNHCHQNFERNYVSL